MSRLKNILTVLLLTALIFVSASKANEYVSLNGEFYIDIPDEWEQIDFATVDAFLARSQADLKAYEYEAVLAVEGSDQFFRDEYLIITIDNIRRMSEKKRDSVLSELGTTYDSRVENGYLDHFMSGAVTDVPVFDREQNTAVVLRKIFMADKTVKYSLNFIKFTDSGLVNFFFFAPGDKFEKSKYKFYEILKSYSTENFRDKLPKEEVKVADINIENDETTSEKKSSDKSSTTTWIPVFVVLLIVVIVAAKKRKRKKS